MQLHTAIKKPQKIRLALYGPSGSGKTLSSLLLAYGMCGNWNKIALIDTERGSACDYSHLGPFQTVQIGAPYNPSKYYEALDLCLDSGMEVIIIDSMSHEWMGEGGVLENLKGEDYDETLREHRCLLSLISSAEAHVICTMRSLRLLVSIKHGSERHLQPLYSPLQHQGIEYPFTTVLRLNSSHKAYVAKDRSGVFEGKPRMLPEPDHGTFLRQWADEGEVVVPTDLQQRIDSCTTVSELHRLLASEGLEDVELISAFTRRRLELEGIDYRQAA